MMMQLGMYITQSSWSVHKRACYSIRFAILLSSRPLACAIYLIWSLGLSQPRTTAKHAQEKRREDVPKAKSQSKYTLNC